jgi:hypothetical protein
MVAIAQAVATTDGSETAALGGIALDCRIEGCPIEPCHVAGFFWITGPPRPRQFDTLCVLYQGAGHQVKDNARADRCAAEAVDRLA